jgi:hypothetical protein
MAAWFDILAKVIERFWERSLTEGTPKNKLSTVG